MHIQSLTTLRFSIPAQPSPSLITFPFRFEGLYKELTVWKDRSGEKHLFAQSISSLSFSFLESQMCKGLSHLPSSCLEKYAFYLFFKSILISVLINRSLRVNVHRALYYVHSINAIEDAMFGYISCL